MTTRKRTIPSGISFHKKAPRLRNALDPFLDLFTDEILSYRISKQPNAKALLKAQRKAIEQTKDLSVSSHLLSIKDKPNEAIQKTSN